jgi:hypothetical protein
MLIYFNKIFFGIFLVLTVLLMIQGSDAKAQTKTYLTGQKTGNYISAGSLFSLGPGNAEITEPMEHHTTGTLLKTHQFFYGNNILNTDNNTPTVVRASRTLGIAGLAGFGADAYIQFRVNGNSPNIPANKPTYFKLGSKPELTGIGVHLLGLLGLAELHNIQGVAYSGAGNYSLSGSGNENPGTIAGTTSTKLLIDKEGNWFAAATPSADYNSIRLNVAFPTDINVLAVNRNLNVNVYNAFTLTAGDACSAKPYFTSPGEVTGIQLVTPSLGIPLNQLVTNPHQAINGVASEYSTFSTGVAGLGVASTISQTFYFDHTVASSDAVTFRLGLTKSLVDLNLLGNGVTFRFFNDDTEVGAIQDLRSQLLHLNVLQLITVDAGFTQTNVTVKPTVSQPFNRVSISYKTGLVDVNVLGDALHIYDVSLTPEAPIFSAPLSDSLTICSSSTANLKANAPSGSTLVWYNGESGGTALTSNPDGSYTTPPLFANKTFYVASRKCSVESARVPVHVTVNPLPSITPGPDIFVCLGIDNCNIPYSATTGAPTTYSITWNAPGTDLENIANATIGASPLNVLVPSNLPAGTYQGVITVKNEECSSTGANFSMVVHAKTPAPQISVQ